MELSSEEQKITINRLVGKKTKKILIEKDIIIPDIKPDILDTIDSEGNIYIYKKDILDGKVKISGGIDLYVIYLSDSETDIQRGLNANLDFNQTIEMEECKSNMNMRSTAVINKIEANVLNGRKLRVKIEMQINIQIYSREDINILNEIKNIQNIQILKEKMQINTLIGSGEVKLSAKDTIAYNNADTLAEVIKTSLNIVNKEIKISYNKVLIKADLNIKIIYLKEDGEVNVLNTNIPIVGFIDIPNISEDHTVITDYEIRNILIKPNTEEHTIDIDIQVGASCMAYGRKEMELIKDMYSTEDEINFTTNIIETEANKMIKKDIFNINENINIPEISNNKIYDLDVKTVLNNAKVMNKRVIYDGEIICDFLFKSKGRSEIESRIYNFPFNLEMEEDSIRTSQKADTKIECLDSNYKVISDGNIDFNLNLQFSTELSDIKQIKTINQINVVNKEEQNDCNMIVHIVKGGDTLWNIAKKYKTTVNTIKEINCIENEELNIGEKLYIQKFKKNKKIIE